MVNFLAFMWQLCFLWGFRLRVTPLSLSPSYVTHYKNLKRAFILSCHAQQTRRKSEYSWSNRDSVLWKAKGICGTTSLRVSVLALFYESVKKGTKTIRKSKKTTITNWTNEVKPQTRQILKQYALRMYGTLFLCLSLVYLLRSS